MNLIILELHTWCNCSSLFHVLYLFEQKKNSSHVNLQWFCISENSITFTNVKSYRATIDFTENTVYANT